MPLISFSKSRSQTFQSRSSTAVSSFSGNGQNALAGPSTSSIHVNASSAASFTSSYTGNRSLGRTKHRFSKAFTFSLESFNVAGSIRGRSKPISDLNKNDSSRSVSRSYMSYAGYEDEDYGEPDVEAEEIRPPSGLGRAATVLEFNDSVVNNSKCAAASFSREPRISESSDDADSLVEIRYPSGLGDIKLTVTPVSATRTKFPARSTYPDFYLQCQSSQPNLSPNKSKLPAVKTVAPLTPTTSTHFKVLSHHSSSVKLCKLLTILNPYLDKSTLCTLTLVSRNVGSEARKLLWCHGHIALRLVLSESGLSALLDGQKATTFLDFLSKKDVSHFIKSLELICSLELEPSLVRRQLPVQGAVTVPHRLPRSRPPPLSLNFNNHDTPQMIPQSRAPIPSPSPITVQTTSSPSPFRRARMLINNSTIPSAFRNSSLGRRLSTLRAPSRRGPLEGSSSLPTGQEPILSDTQSRLSHLASLSISSSTWQPPPEWDRVESGSGLCSTPSTTHVSPQRSASPSSPRTPTPHSGRIPSPSTLIPKVSLPSLSGSVHKTRHIPSLPDLKPGKHNPRLSLSLLPGTQSTPSLEPRSLLVNASPSSPGYTFPSPFTGMSAPPPPPSFRFEQPFPGPSSVPPTPVTPHSAISLSAFPLPPSSASPHSLLSASPSILRPNPKVSATTSDKHSPLQQTVAIPLVHQSYNDHGSRASLDAADPSTQYILAPIETVHLSLKPVELEVDAVSITITAVQPGFIDGLKMGLRELANLEAVTIRYDTTGGPSHLSIHRSNLRFNLLRTVNQLLVSSLKDIQTLRSIRVACPSDYSSLCATQLSELERMFTKVKTSVVVSD